ncbi:hypothetical protein CS022_11025 [Veronia nyctiphanis]|uniref:DUF962 domain-containing protein n=1 Tax=Veronia nyctiphanis TaxID=1278244 RepID=A0A4Q0YRI7_9GAMM|nr:Mpo1-like protein [Veronia nyctiphanis]RXJ73255.1 hypothetical protein CS022_11025 [Veronia nyctiphanis]
MRSLNSWLEEYSESHQNKTNKFIHYFAVPSIYFTVMGFLYALPAIPALPGEWWNNWMVLIMPVVMVFYFSLSLALGIGMSLFTALCYYLLVMYEQAGISTVFEMSLALFVVMWIFQFVGHKIEGKKPSFFKDIQFLLIGPAWVVVWMQKAIVNR